MRVKKYVAWLSILAIGMTHVAQGRKPYVHLVPHDAMFNKPEFRDLMKKALARKGYDLVVSHDYPQDNKHLKMLVVENPEPRDRIFKYPIEKRAVILWEPPSVKPYSYEESYLAGLPLVFTWDDALVDGVQFIKIHYQAPDKRPLLHQRVPWSQKKLMVMLNGNKFSRHPDELYVRRREFIAFACEHCPRDFDLYGASWPMNLPVYRGWVEDKLNTLCYYKFNIAYENICNIQGYVTEKIVDSMWAGCVPVYWGADNITDYVPAACFIDRRDFGSDEELYNYLRSMDFETYTQYQQAIDIFIQSPAAYNFTVQDCVDRLVQGIIHAIKRTDVALAGAR